MTVRSGLSYARETTMKNTAAIKVFQRFQRLGIDLAPLGVEQREDTTPYFCTPKGASIFGWGGADGVHYCFIRGFGEMVFAVSPMNAAPNYVHPLAESFADFLRLLLACGDAAALEQAWMWDRTQFEAFSADHPATEEQERTLTIIAENTKLTAMENPWEYICALQASFAYSKLRYMEDCCDTERDRADEGPAPDWKVYFDGGFWDHWGKDRPGAEIPIGKTFTWANHEWLIPAAYSCGKGLVVDLCMRVQTERIRAFMEKWNLSWENDSCENFTREQRMEMENDNPLNFALYPQLACNGRVLECSGGCAVSYNPCVPEGIKNDPKAIWSMEHYGLAFSCGWVIHRYAFPWARRRPAIKTLSLMMKQEPERVPGPRFTAHAPGDTFCFTHPVSGTEYTLTVRELERQTIPEAAFGIDRMIFPTHCTAMSYMLTPDTSEQIIISDCDSGDQPVEAAPPPEDGCAPLAINCAAFVGIIGGADGPTAIAMGRRTKNNLHAVCSSLHFEPVRQDVEWRVSFFVKRAEDTSLSLI